MSPPSVVRLFEGSTLKINVVKLSSKISLFFSKFDRNMGTDLPQILIGELVLTMEMFLSWFKKNLSLVS